jgi:hypothetical protein
MRGGNGIFGVIAGIDGDRPGNTSDVEWGGIIAFAGGLQSCENTRFCIDSAVVSSPFLTTVADVIGRVISALTKTVHPR